MKSSKNKTVAKTKKDDSDFRIQQLEQELAQTYEDMRSITEEQEAANEELQSANEELLSGSEELQSLNEELETSTEELQSASEELTVVNHELINLNEQVTKAKDYTESIVSAIREPLLVLDKNLRIKTANSAFYKIFRVNEQETENKLIYELSGGQWNIPALRTLLEEILPEKTKFEDFEIRHRFSILGERTMLLNAREIKSDTISEKLILLAIEDITEKKIADDKLKESEERYFRLLKTLPTAIYTCDARGFITYYNDAAVELWGRKPILNKDMWCGSWKMFRTDGTPVPLDECPMAVTLKEGKNEPGEEFIVERPDGTRRFMIPHPQTEFDSSGKITGSVNTLIDITNLKEVELAVRHSDQRYRNLIEQATAAMAVLQGPERIITIANDAMLTLWGKDESVIGKGLLDIMPEIVDQQFPQILEEVYTTGNPYVVEDALVVLERKGELQNIYMDYSYTALRGFNNEITAILVNGSDVTENLLYKRQLEESEQNFRNIIEHSPVAMCVLRGPEFIVEIANERMFEVWGKNADEVLHKPIFIGLPEVKGQGVNEILGKVYSSGERFSASEFKIDLFRKGKPETIYANFVYEALRESDGSISGIVVVAIDVSDQIKARLESEYLQQQKDDFLGIASHELKTPVTIIKAYSQILEKILSKKGNSQEAEMAGKMNVQTNRLNNLIVDLLDTTKINSGKLQFNDSDFKFNELVEDVLDDMKYTTQTHTIIHEFGLPCVVHGDKERLGQVIDNFITNAVKYSPKADKIIVRTMLNKHEVHLSVEDFGIGISPEKKEKVFDQFYRVSSGIGMQNTYPGLGLGLGLFIAAEIIRRENGRIWVESEEGKGSIFSFSLPCKEM